MSVIVTKLNLSWFKCKVAYEKMMENGMQKKVTEPYLVDALSYTEAEANIIKEIKPYITGEYTVGDITRPKYMETFLGKDYDRFWEAKVEFVSLDEKSGSEKKQRVKMLVGSSYDMADAKKVLEEGMKGTMAVWRCVSLTETPIMDIFVSQEADKKKIGQK